MVGKIFITRSGYDPQLGKHVKDPYLGDCPTLGACRPDVREQLQLGDHIFVVSGRVPDAHQFVMGGFEVAEKITAIEAFARFPKLRLRMRPDGQLTGNIIVNPDGLQNDLDDHPVSSFDRRIQNYIVGKDLLSLSSAAEIARGREYILEMLREILKRKGDSPFEIIGRFGRRLSQKQVIRLREWLAALKQTARN